jgi:hypothetical protein
MDFLEGQIDLAKGHGVYSLIGPCVLICGKKTKNKKKNLQCKETAAGEEIVGIVVGVIEREYIVQRCGQ